MEPVTSGVAHGENERLTGAIPFIRKVVGLVDDFVKEGNHVHRVRRRTATVIVRSIIGIRHVRLVVGTIEVDAVPATREEDLGADTIWTVDVGKMVVLT